jgi:hypothetical protein
MSWEKVGMLEGHEASTVWADYGNSDPIADIMRMKDELDRLAMQPPEPYPCRILNTRQVMAESMSPSLAYFGGIQLIVMPFPMITVQARRHKRKKRRIQKKWLARYGTIRVPSPNESPFNFYVIQGRVAYCYEQGKQALLTVMEVDRHAKNQLT